MTDYKFHFHGEKRSFFLWDPILTRNGKASSFLFKDPKRILTISWPCELDEIERAFSEIEKGVSSGLYACGWLSYELGYLLIPKLTHLIKKDIHEIPLLWFGLFERPEPVSIPLESRKTGHISLRLDTARDEFVSRIKKIHDYIRAGDTYQINYTISGRFNYNGDPFDLYLGLRERQRVKYACFTRTDMDLDVLSLSPELFFRVKDGYIWSKPMKGTASRGKDEKEDRNIEKNLKNDPKNRAENVMIVDLLRNDLGRICEIGSVSVPELFKVERYETLFQMISKVRGKLRKGIRLLDIFRAIFPCGSITGAPKIRSMEIIPELEKAPRGIYTGAIGFISPNGEAYFNVAIRTITMKNKIGQIGIGAGITIGSDPISEFEETVLKASFLTDDISF